MRRQERFPDTDTFHFYNANPHNRLGGDCAIRAICTALEKPWEETVMEMTMTGLKCGRVVNDKKNIAQYLKDQGWVKQPQPRKPDGTKYTGAEFCKITHPGARYILNIGGHHMVAIIGGKVNDIWDSTGGCVGNYWVKE